jgi:hypothetical protein
VFSVGCFIAPPAAFFACWPSFVARPPIWGLVAFLLAVLLGICLHLAGRFYRDRIAVIRGRVDHAQRVAKIRAEEMTSRRAL